MVHWLGDVECKVESFILKETNIRDLDDFATNHERYLVSIVDAPAQAARWWRWQRNKTNPGEGWISMRLNDAEMMPRNAWTNIEFFWEMALNVIDNYLITGEGAGTFSEETAQFSILKKDSVALVDVRGNKYPVDPDTFLASLLDGARQFYMWTNEYIGTLDNSYLARVNNTATRLLHGYQV